MPISHEELKRLLHYDPETGVWTWLCGRLHGRIAGCIDKSRGNYLFIMVKRRKYRAHLLAWFYMTGSWPSHLVDHRDRKKNNSAFSNLRPATKTQNATNANLYSNNTSGFKGVYLNRKTRSWRVEINHGGKKLGFGSYACRPAAHFVHLVEYDRLFGEYGNA